MDAISRLYFDLIGRDKGASKVMGEIGAKAQAAHTGLSKLGSSLSGLGGPFDQITTLASNLGDAMDGTLARAQKLGLGITAAGVALTAFAAADQQSASQLRASIQDTGASYDDYRKRIEGAVSEQENFGHAAHDTQDALNTLTVATQDPTRALEEMGVVADLAAQKHENLADAAKQLVLAQEGNLRALRSFGISLDGQGTKTEQLNRALKDLQDRLHGQASAAVDTFAGHLKVLGVRLEDDLAKLGKYGPQITAVGAGLTAYASILQLIAARKLRDTLATTAETRAEGANAAARIRTAEAADVESAAIQRASLVQSEGAVIGDAMAANLGGVGLRSLGGRIGGPLLRAGGYALGGQLIGGFIGGSTGAAISGAGTGAALGSFVGPEGTAVGAALGAIIGALSHTSTAHVDPSALGQLAKTSAGLTAIQTQAAVRANPNSVSPNAYSNALNALTPKQMDLVQNATKAQLDAAKSSAQYATALIKEKAAALQAAAGLAGHIKALQATVAANMNLQSTQDDASTAMHNLAQSVHDGSTALKGYSTNAINNRAALRDVVTKELDVIKALREHHVRADKVTAAAKDMSKAIEHNAEKLGLERDAVRHLLKQLGVLPGQIEKALSSAALAAEQTGRDLVDFYAAGVYAESDKLPLAGQYAAAQAMKGLRLGDTQGGGATQSYTTPDPKAAKAAAEYGRKTAHNVISAAAPAIDKGINDATKTALDKAKQLLAQQAQYMRTTLQQIEGAYQSTKASLVDAASVANRQQGTDILGASGPAQSILAAKRQFAHQLVQFAHLLHRLEGAHYSRVIIDEVESLGAAAGIDAARELLAGGRKERREVNRAERRIQAAAGRISAQTTSADYESEILKALQKLPDQFDRKFERTLARLHIITDTGSQDRKQGHRVRTH